MTRLKIIAGRWLIILLFVPFVICYTLSMSFAIVGEVAMFVFGWLFAFDSDKCPLFDAHEAFEDWAKKIIKKLLNQTDQ
jgi:hypothetical protein